MIIILVGINEDACLEAPLKDKKYVVRVVRLHWKYEWLVHLVLEIFL